MYEINHKSGIIGDKVHVRSWAKTRKLGPDNKYYTTNHAKEGSFNIGDYDSIIEFINYFNISVQRWQLYSVIDVDLIKRELEYIPPRSSGFVLDPDQTHQSEIDLKDID